MEADLPLAGVRCGACGYCLHGLPSAGRCPECGTGYSAHLFCGAAFPRFADLLLPAIPFAISLLLAAFLARSRLQFILWPMLLACALTVVWAKRIATRTAHAAYLEVLAATPIEQPPPSRAWYCAVRSVLFFATEITFGLVLLFLMIVLLVARYD